MILRAIPEQSPEVTDEEWSKQATRHMIEARNHAAKAAALIT